MKLDNSVRRRRQLTALLLVFVSAASVAGVPASGIPAAGMPMVELVDLDRPVSLAVAWRFQPGDDMRWAGPDFDDSDWREVRIPTGFGRFDAEAEIAWYRLEIQIGPSGRGPAPEELADLRLAITIGKVDSAYEIFANGVRLGGVGKLPPSPRMDYDRHRTYRVPPYAVDSGGRLVLALRVWKSPYTWGEVGGPHEGPFLIGREADLARRELLSELPVLFLAGLFLVVGLFHLALFHNRRRQRGYLWFFCCSSVFAGYAFLRTQWKYALGDLLEVNARVDYFLVVKELEYFLLFALVAGFIQLVWPLLGLRIGRFLRAYQVLNLATGLLVAVTPGVRLNMLVLPYWELTLLGLIAYGVWAIVREAWRKHPEARIIAVGAIGSTAAFLNDIAIDRGLIVGPRLIAFGFAFLILSLALSLANRFHRTHRELEALRQDLESRVEERTHQLLEASQAKSRFLATMSHEIRTPLNGVIGLTELMLGTELDATQRDYADKTLRCGDALLALVDDILDFSRIEAGRIKLETRPFRVRDVVEQSLDMLSRKAADKDLDLSYGIDERTPEAVIGDPDRLRQILVNLIDNAVKFTEQGAVYLEVRTRGQLLYFRVSDTGIGIAENRLDQLFEVFTQVDAEDGKLRGGTGLGLAICRRLCEAMGGVIWAESKVGRGSIFHFTIKGEPVPISMLAGDAAEVAARPDRLPPLRILLADDDAVNLTVARGMLAKLGYRADVAGNGREVLVALSRRSYDLVLLDVQMPELDGLETARRIRRSPPDGKQPRLIAMTAHAAEEDRQRCLAAGMDDYLSKPLKLGLLTAALERCRPAGDPAVAVAGG